jgi:hypothetical protein
MALIAGGRDLIDRAVMQKTAAIEIMSRGCQNQGRVVSHPSLAVTLIAGWFAVRATQQMGSMTWLAVAFRTLRGGSVGDPSLIDAVSANAADSLVLYAAGCENKAKPD